MPEPRAIVAAVLMAAFALSATLWTLARNSRDAVVVREWAAGTLAAAAGALLNVAQEELPAWLAVTLAAPMMLQGIALMVLGVRRLRGLPPRYGLHSVPAAIMMVAAILWAHIEVNLTARIILFSVLAAGLHVLLIVALWPLRNGRLRAGVLFVILPAGLMALMLAFRAAATAVVHAQSVTTGGGLNTLTYLIAGMAMVAMQTGLILLQQLLMLDEIRDVADHDALTRLLNRRGLEQSLSGNLSGAVVLSLDIDHFKTVNDQHGHEAGDRVLEFLGSLLLRHLREGDLAVRMGGEEFGVVLRHTHGGTAMEVAERIRRDIQDHSAAAAGQTVTVSIGVAAARENEAFDGAWRRADEAMYEAKRRGRNRCLGATDSGSVFVESVQEPRPTL